jgi:hypothetical protein
MVLINHQVQIKRKMEDTRRHIKAIGMGFTVLFYLVSCNEDQDVQVNDPESYTYPTVTFLLSNDVLFENADTIRLVVEPKATASTIRKVEILINDTIVYTTYERPYQYNWYEEQLIEPGSYEIKAITYDEQDSIGTDARLIEIRDFREKHFGYYSFVSESYCPGGGTIRGYPSYGMIKAFEPADTIYQDGLINYTSENFTLPPANRRITITTRSTVLTPALSPESDALHGFVITRNSHDEWIYEWIKIGGFESSNTLALGYKVLNLGGYCDYSIDGLKATN